MQALRCKNCGDTRWSLIGFRGSREPRCEICGGEMVPERRLPSRGPARPGVERRTAPPRDPDAGRGGPRSAAPL